MYTFINIINLSIRIYPYKIELDLPRVRLNGRLNSCLARLMLFISVPFRPFRSFFPFFDRLNGQPFNFRLPPKQNSLPMFTVYWPFKRPFNPFRRTLPAVLESVDCKQWEEENIDAADLQLVQVSVLAPQCFHLGTWNE